MTDPTTLILLYFVIPVWFMAGLADYLCHRSSHIESTSGVKESLIHVLMFAEVGIPLLSGIYLEINSGIMIMMAVMFVIHEATALWDVTYAITDRYVSPIEQAVHSFLEVIPLMALGFIIALHWEQFLAIFGAGVETARFSVEWKHHSLPNFYVAAIMAAILIFEFLPYAEELLSCLEFRAKGSLGE
jgi:hypothetical protein